MESTLFDREPVLAVCGWSGSGKTTVLETVIPLLVERGLRVAVVKHDAHGIEVDREGKDSARFFSAGADVHLHAPEEQMIRFRNRPEDSLEKTIFSLLSTHDLVLIEGHKETPLPKIWCHGKGENTVPDGIPGVTVTLPWDGNRTAMLVSIAKEQIRQASADRPLFGGILIGGESRRMGSPKHILNIGGRSMLSTVAAVLRLRTERIVVLGRGDIPNDAGPLDQLGDAPGSGEGPLAGLLTAFRWAPRACWVVGACDMPCISVEALSWLVDQRRPGCWAVIPRDAEGRVQPTLALYEPQASTLIDTLVSRGLRSPRALAQWPEVRTPTIPDALSGAWINVNTPEELEVFRGGDGLPAHPEIRGAETRNSKLET